MEALGKSRGGGDSLFLQRGVQKSWGGRGKRSGESLVSWLSQRGSKAPKGATRVPAQPCVCCARSGKSCAGSCKGLLGVGSPMGPRGCLLLLPCVPGPRRGPPWPRFSSETRFNKWGESSGLEGGDVGSPVTSAHGAEGLGSDQGCCWPCTATSGGPWLVAAPPARQGWPASAPGFCGDAAGDWPWWHHGGEVSWTSPPPATVA